MALLNNDPSTLLRAPQLFRSSRFFRDQNLAGHPKWNQAAKFADKCPRRTTAASSASTNAKLRTGSPFALFQNSTLVSNDYVAKLAQQAMEVSFQRFDIVTGFHRQQQQYTSSQCIQASLDCYQTTHWKPKQKPPTAFDRCWCLQVDFYSGKVAYLSKKGLYEGEGKNASLDSWESDFYANLQLAMNSIQLAVQEYKQHLPQQGVTYMLFNLWDEPMLFVPSDNIDKLKTLPQLSPGHPGHDFLEINRKKWFSFDASFYHLDSVMGRDVCGDFPVFSWSVNPLHSFDILAPHKHGGDCQGMFLDPKIPNIPWEEKTDTVSFYGNIFSCDSEEHHNHRNRLCGMVARKWKQEIEQRFNVAVDIPVRNDKHKTPTDQAASKFLILMDGVVAAFRSTWYLASGSVILATCNHVDFRTVMMIPYVHYIPFSPMDLEFDGFMDALAMVADNDDYARWVGDNARRLGKVLTSKGDQYDFGEHWDRLYFAQVIQHYSWRYSIKEDHDPAKHDFTTDRSCETFSKVSPQQSIIRFGCFNETYACSNVLQDGSVDNPYMKFVEAVT
ncbi:expressed unknown protein [Seminavis robusta]|uniref:Glycosyl transferase CAP10 domain-containing protein n=1 Tax=Seminavis robusta TaxID=568900 RepID=A0A9N8HQG8_9STRA|nr:expressed unknown protein [Seminavis robusta]|eukprot:Sro1165_g248140.1 n/a (557) ;mRNA; r:25141-26811